MCPAEAFCSSGAVTADSNRQLRMVFERSMEVGWYELAGVLRSKYEEGAM